MASKRWSKKKVKSMNLRSGRTTAEAMFDIRRTDRDKDKSKATVYIFSVLRPPSYRCKSSTSILG